ncbi:uncharacterized protein LOC106173985 [Lingula anatina]|uniref:Uncharacterized protein LOC106173985 n=1 Tax=Lingula anatina TaxID=7574 RepID=A0A1S3JK94_LINAN|nr:uncharacterized protein LOC106173985 [Lingula anatina]|eukprot:XP_013410797.1 uncharacterized protein LOC106173985 [Lingula anatina]
MAKTELTSRAALFVIVWACLAVPGAQAELCSELNCMPPHCRCPSTQAPFSLPPGDIPQLVVFSFDGPVTPKYADFYQRLFPVGLVNPNKCSAGVTLFVSNAGEEGRIRTDYASVQKLYRLGYEIGVNSMSMKRPEMFWNDATYEEYVTEMVGQRYLLSLKARIPPSQIRGLRVPYLQPGGNNQFRMMADKNFMYDSSLVTGPVSEDATENQPAVFPYTLDVPPEKYLCDIAPGNCPTDPFPGIWEFPLNRLFSTHGAPCAVADDCQTNSADDTFRYLMKNFLRHYKGQRAPLGLFIRPTWFEKNNYTLAGVDAFLKNMTARKDVWVVTMAQAIEWMKAPKSNSQLLMASKDCNVNPPLLANNATLDIIDLYDPEVTSSTSTTPATTKQGKTTASSPAHGDRHIDSRNRANSEMFYFKLLAFICSLLVYHLIL